MFRDEPDKWHPIEALGGFERFVVLRKPGETPVVALHRRHGICTTEYGVDWEPEQFCELPENT